MSFLCPSTSYCASLCSPHICDITHMRTCTNPQIHWLYLYVLGWQVVLAKILFVCVSVCMRVHMYACVCLHMLCWCVFVTCIFTTWNLFLSHFSKMLAYGFEFYTTVLTTLVKTPINCLNSIYILFQVTINANFIMIYLLKPSWLMPRFLAICFYC